MINVDKSLKRLPKVLVEFHEGRVVSLFLENGFLDRCVDCGAEVKVICPATKVPGFVEKYGKEAISWVSLPVNRDLSRVETVFMKFGRTLSTNSLIRTRRLLWAFVERRVSANKASTERQLIREFKPDVVFSPHIAEGFGRRLIVAAAAEGVRSVGNLVSWDNAYRPLRSRPEEITCWSHRTKTELCDWCAYKQDEVVVTGAPAFDPYFAEGGSWTKDQLCTHLGLDPERPIILYASLGQFRPFMDETGTFAGLLESIDSGLIPGRPQVVLRLHPLSRLVYFQSLIERPDVTVSRFKGYVPGMMWTPTRDEVILAGNLMRHADVCVSPGSTMTIEPAIFDTPTILPVVNLYTQDAYTKFFRQVWLDGHFREIVEKDWVPVVRTVEALGAAVAKALEEPAWYRDGRAAIRETILGPLDGQATERIAAFVVRPREKNA